MLIKNFEFSIYLFSSVLAQKLCKLLDSRTIKQMDDADQIISLLKSMRKIK